MLREHRLAKGITQKQLADALGKPQSFIAAIEANQRRVDLVELVQFAELLDIDIPATVKRIRQTDPD